MKSLNCLRIVVFIQQARAGANEAANRGYPDDKEVRRTDLWAFGPSHNDR